MSSDYYGNMFLATFLEEALEMLASWEKACLSLDRLWTSADCDALFRAAHNLKGSSRAVGLQAFGGFVHVVEDAIGSLREGRTEPSAERTGIFFDAQALLLQWVKRVSDEPEYVPTAEVARLSARLAEGFAAIKGGEPAAAEPPPVDLGTSLVDSGFVSFDDVDEAARLQRRKIGEILVDQGKVTTEQVTAAVAAQKAKAGGKVDETIRVSTTKLEGLMRLVGELSVQQSIVFHAGQANALHTKSAQNAMYLSHKLTKELQSRSISLRMQTIAPLFQRLERNIKDIARELKKPVEVICEGDHVELDKTVIERMTDPLVHLVRNAVDHGIEKSNERPAHKPGTARIILDAAQSPAGVTIRVRDDGRGLDESRILKKAREKGIIGPDHTPPSDEIRRLIFAPGFSTAEAVTDLSGRGVGLDVVKKTVDDLGGTLDIETELGSGTTFSVSLPTNVSIVPALIVEVDGTQYAVPIQGLSEIVDTAGQNSGQAKGPSRMLDLRGQIVPIENLAVYLPTGRQKPSLTTDHQRPTLLTKVDSKTVGFYVDRILSQYDVVVRSLDESIDKVPGITGGTILADGEPGLIINLETIARLYLKATGHNANGSAA